MNPFYNPMQQTPQNSGFGPFGNLMNMISRFNEFKASIQGNPETKVRELLSSGQMSQQQFDQLSMLANQFKQFLH